MTEEKVKAKQELLENIEGVKQEELPIIWEPELKKIQVSSTKWVVDGLVPEKGVVLIAGKSMNYKTFGALHIAIAIAAGLPVFNLFRSSKRTVLFIDEENGENLLKERVEMIKLGLGIKSDLENLGFVIFKSIKLDKDVWKKKIENSLEKQKSPLVIIVDGLRRVISAEENDATQINKIFTEIIRPITEKYNSTWIFLHHLRKGMAGKVSEDRLDDLRGSSEIVNYVDGVLIFERPKKTVNKILVSHAKSRRTKQNEPYFVDLIWEGESSVKFNYVGSAEAILDTIDLCCKAIMVWLEENNICQFKTSEVMAIMKGRTFSESTVKRSLPILIAQGKLRKGVRGKYEKVVSTLNDHLNEGSNGSPIYSSDPIDPKSNEDSNDQLCQEPIDPNDPNINSRVNKVNLYSIDPSDPNFKDSPLERLKRIREKCGKVVSYNTLKTELFGFYSNFDEFLRKLLSDGKLSDLGSQGFEILC